MTINRFTTTNVFLFSIFIGVIFVNFTTATSDEQSVPRSTNAQPAAAANSTKAMMTSLNRQPNLNENTSVAQNTTGNNMTVPEQQAKAVLKYVFLLFRHGDRAPVALYPKDPYPAYIFEPGLQQLTNPPKILKSISSLSYTRMAHFFFQTNDCASKNQNAFPSSHLWRVLYEQSATLRQEGKRRAFKLGENLRARYGNLSGESYNVTKITFNSTSVNRCLETAECVAAGWFPPQGSQIWNPQLSWQPIPIYTVPIASDYIISMTGYCSNADAEQTRYFDQSPKVKDICSKYGDVIDQIHIGTGLPTSPCNSYQTFLSIEEAYDTVFVQTTQYNLPVPDWAKPYFPHPLQEMRGETAQITFEDGRYASLRVGPMYEVILSDMKRIVNDITIPPIHVISAHDSTIVAAQRPLKIYNNISPPYTACMAFELWQKENDEYTVETVYSNSTEYPFYKLELPECPDPCTYDRFSKLLKTFIIENYTQACFEQKAPSFPSNRPTTAPTWWLSLTNYLAQNVPGLVFNKISPIGFDYY